MSTESSSIVGQPDDGYRGIWYQNTQMPGDYRFKYSGGLGTYCAKHQPMAVYRPEVEMTFFCFGGVSPGYHQRFDLTVPHLDSMSMPDALQHMIGAYDHRSGDVLRPTRLLDKMTLDAHDNPVLSIDDAGYIWILSTAHGPMRPAFVHRSCKPYDISSFQLIQPLQATAAGDEPIINFSYMQVWHRPGRGFAYFFTGYTANWQRQTYFATSADGHRWSTFQPLASIQKGHYQVSAVHGDIAACACNYHPDEGGLERRTNLYYMQTRDDGRTWQTPAGDPVLLPLRDPQNAALIHDFEADGLLVYMKDLVLSADGRPAILFLTTGGHIPGPTSGVRTLQLARWTGSHWRIRPIATTDSNYDTGSLYLLPDNGIRAIVPTGRGPQPGNPGGEVESWISPDDGQTWTRERTLTSGSPRNHTYIRRPVNAAPGFLAFWADGHGREPSESDFYFSDAAHHVHRLPRHMTADRQRPERIG